MRSYSRRVSGRGVSGAISRGSSILGRILRAADGGTSAGERRDRRAAWHGARSAVRRKNGKGRRRSEPATAAEVRKLAARDPLKATRLLRGARAGAGRLSDEARESLDAAALDPGARKDGARELPLAVVQREDALLDGAVEHAGRP